RREIPASINPSRSRPRASGCAGLRAPRPEFTTWVPGEINLHDVMNVPYSEPSSTPADGEAPPGERRSRHDAWFSFELGGPGRIPGSLVVDSGACADGVGRRTGGHRDRCQRGGDSGRET